MNKQLKSDLQKNESSIDNIDFSFKIIDSIRSMKNDQQKTYPPLIKKGLIIWILALFFSTLIFTILMDFTPVLNRFNIDFEWKIDLNVAFKWILLASGSFCMLLTLEFLYLKNRKSKT